MRFTWPSPVSYVNGRVLTPDGEARSLRVRRRVLSLDEAPRPGDRVVDLDGRFVVPGLINAHDHLELNHYGALKARAQYANASEWIADLTPLVRNDPGIRERSRIALADRLFIGGLKNLLAGTTTVAHHNPLYREFGLRFPVRVVDRYGWAHSLGLERGPCGAYGEPGGVVAERCAQTRADRPFIVHAAEGTDERAADELERLDAAACLRPNTVLVHGLAIEPQRWHALFAQGVSLVWCPASNRFLFGRTLCMPCVLDSPAAVGRVALGSDSRVTGAADLLDEVRVGAESGVPASTLLSMVTSWAADVLRLDDAGRIRVGAPADFIVLPADADSAADALLRCRRSDVALVVRRGTPIVGAMALRSAFDCRAMHVREMTLDGTAHVIEAGLARRIERCLISEPGLQLAAGTER